MKTIIEREVCLRTYECKIDVKYRNKIDESVRQIIPEHVQSLGHSVPVLNRTCIKSSVSSIAGVSTDIIVTNQDGDQLPLLTVPWVGEKLNQPLNLLYQGYTRSSGSN